MAYDVGKWEGRFEEGVEKHEEKRKLIYDGLVNILGPRYVSNDPGISEAYAREWQTATYMTKGRAEFVVLPASTEDVQKIVRLTNRYNFPFSVMSCGLLGPCFAAEGIPYWCQVDLKRMDRFEIDEKNMYAIVEPYVTHAQLQVEAMRKALFNATPSSGSQSSVLANHVCFGYQSTPYRTGFATKNILGVEWVLPSGDILRVGSLAAPGAGYFWGEGPGPDARALVRGLLGHFGSLGIITRMAVKLFPWPGPRVFPVEGAAPNVTVNLPPEKFRWYFIVYPTLEEAMEAIREIGKVEIAAILHRWEARSMISHSCKSIGELRKLQAEGFREKVLGKSTHVLTVGIWGWASDKQAEYEEMVLKEIVEETGGKWVPDEAYQRFVTDIGVDCIRCMSCVRGIKGNRIATLGGAEIEGMGDMPSAIQMVKEVQKKYIPPLLDMDLSYWVAPYDFGHHALLEAYGIGAEVDEEGELEILPISLELMEKQIQEGSMNIYTAVAPQNLVGPFYANIHQITARIKNAVDPKGIANPTRFIDMEA